MKKYTKKEIVTTGVFSIIVVIFLIIVSIAELLCKMLLTIQKISLVTKIILGISLIPIVLIIMPSRSIKKSF